MQTQPVTSSVATTLPAPVARGLSTWPLTPPQFDLLEPFAHEKHETAPVENLASLIERLTAGSVRAARNDSPDLLGQLQAALKRPVDSIICSALDVDPAACVQSAWAAERASDVVAGVAALARVTRANRRMIVIDSRTPDRWFTALRSAARAAQPTVKIIELENDYPQADSTLMMYTVLNRRLRPGRLPVELGAILLDAAAASAVGACVARGEPMKTSPLIFRDHDRGETYFMQVPVGITCRDLLDQLGLLNPGDEQPDIAPIIRAGDVLRDLRIDLNTRLGEAELLVHLSTQPKALNPDPCIRCAWCFEACPIRIQPATLLEASQCEDLELADKAGLKSCIECGICQYVCPSRLPLLRGIRELRRELRGNTGVPPVPGAPHGRDARDTRSSQ